MLRPGRLILVLVGCSAVLVGLVGAFGPPSAQTADPAASADPLASSALTTSSDAPTASSAPADSADGLAPRAAEPLPLGVDPGGEWTPGRAEPDLVAVQQVLDRRAAAVLAEDRAGFLQTTARDSASRARAEEQFTALEQLPVVLWSYSLSARHGGSVVEQAATDRVRALGQPNGYVVRVQLRYRLGGYDRAVVGSAHHVTVAHDSELRWSVLDDRPSDGSHELWDLGALHVRSGERSLVIGVGDWSDGEVWDRLSDYSSAADRAVSDITALWPEPWQRRVVVVAPSSPATMGLLLGRDASRYRRVAAVATGPSDRPDRVSRGDRVVVSPAVFGELGPRGRLTVLRHEVTHVATRATAPDDLPSWLEEGFADYLGYLGSGVPESTIVAELGEWVRGGGRPVELPPDAAFSARGADLVVNYEMSWLAASMLAERYGHDVLVELYRAARTATGQDPVHGVDTAFRQVLGTTLAEFTWDWQARVLDLGR